MFLYYYYTMLSNMEYLFIDLVITNTLFVTMSSRNSVDTLIV